MFLSAETRNDVNAIRTALYEYFESTIGAHIVTRNGINCYAQQTIVTTQQEIVCGR